MAATANSSVELAEALGLRPGADGLFAGKIQGFPVGLKIIVSEVAAVLLFQIRHWLTKQVVASKSLVYDSMVSHLLSEKAIEIEMEDRMAWVTINDPEKCLESAPLSQLVQSVLNSFAQAGLIGDPELCHYCQKERAPSLTTSDGNVAQICESCLNERMAGPRAEQMIAGAESVSIGLLTPVAALLGALLWAVCWAGYDWFFESTGADSVPIAGMLIYVMTLAVLVGGPVGWIVRKDRRRGRRSSVLAATIFSGCAVAVGEVVYLTWLVFRETGVVSPTTALRAMPDFYLQHDAMAIWFRACAALASMAAAGVISEPKGARPKL